jgi:iron complex transport system substrate-binding protein
MISNPNMKRAASLFIALVVALTACGGGDSDGDAAADSASPDAVTIEHQYGETVLDAVPERIVSVNTQWTDVLVELDAPLVAAALDPLVDDGRYPWQGDIPESVEAIPVTDTVPFEAIAAQQPDLIVVSWAAADQNTYDRLTEIAPTIPLLGEADVDQWQDIATLAGEILELPDEAAALVAEADQTSADVLAELPGLEGRTYTLVNYVPGDAIYVVADPNDGAATFFAQLGMAIDPDLVAMDDGGSGRLTLSLEQIGLLDADMLVLLTNGADPTDIPGYSNLPAVESGAVSVLDVADVTGLNTPTPLSIPYCLDVIRPALEAVAAG